MNNLYDEYIINILEKEIKNTKRKIYKKRYFMTKNINQKYLIELEKLLSFYYKEYYIKE